jgi:transcriptional regulator with XRE-family HTH domain
MGIEAAIKREDSAVIVRRISRLMRGTRKHLGFSQSTIAQVLGVDQSGLSRIESGLQILTTPQWFDFCRFTGITPDSLSFGYVELERRSSDDVRSHLDIAPRYNFHAYTSVRALLPLLARLESLLGSDKMEEFIKENGVDPDVFVDLNSKVNINFSIDLCRQMIKIGAIRRKNLSLITGEFKKPEMHGVLRYQYNLYSSNRLELIKALIGNAALYESNFTYLIEDVRRKHVDVSVSPNLHLREFRYRNDPVLGDFFCHYKRQLLSQFLRYGGGNFGRVTILENHYRRAAKCIYRVEVA